MEPLLPEGEQRRLEQLSLDERASALEDLERRLRNTLNDDSNRD
jgi:hypothetical protein